MGKHGAQRRGGVSLQTRTFNIAAGVLSLPVLLIGMGGIAFADNIQDTIADTGAGVTLVAGSSDAGTAAIRLIGNNAQGDPDSGCNVDAGENPLRLDIVTPAGVTATPDPLNITSCGTDFSVSFVASASAVSGHVTVTVLSGPAGGGTYLNQVDIPITINTKPTVSINGVTNGASYVVGAVPAATCDATDNETADIPSFPASLSGTLIDGLGTQTATCDYTDPGGLAADTKSATYSIVPPPNTKPSVSISGVTDGSSYEIGTSLSPICHVTDVEDGDTTFAAIVTGTLSHGLGELTATCNYTDEGGLAADTAAATYTIADTGNPTISHQLTSAGTENSFGWYNKDVTVTFTCGDSGSGVQSCLADGETVNFKTLGEGADQSVSGTATDWAGNIETDEALDIDIDKTVPSVSLEGGPTSSYYFGDDPAAPTCAATDGLSGLKGCVVTGGGTSVGAHSYTATATDYAGNVNTATLNYTVLAWNLKGFYSPVDMNGVWNTVKGGSTVPLKFEVFAGTNELTNTAVATFTAKGIPCPVTGYVTDDIEVLSSGGTSLRYDSTGGQFIQNWQTPKKAGACYAVTMTTDDQSSITAKFVLK